MEKHSVIKSNNDRCEWMDDADADTDDDEDDKETKMDGVKCLNKLVLILLLFFGIYKPIASITPFRL